MVLRGSIEHTQARNGRTKPYHPSRLFRDNVAALGLRTALRLVGLYGRGRRNALNPIARELSFEFSNLPPAFDGFRILHLADLHIDGVDGLAEVVAQVVASVEVDLCVMTGDYRFHLEGSCAAVHPRMRTILSSVRARHGVFAVLGNHDSLEIARGLESQGVRVLMNEAVEIARETEGIWITGVDDPHHYRCDDLTRALETVPPAAFNILLVHTPELYAEAAAAGINLYLCGHTHGGQIRLPWIGAILLNAACPRSYAYGKWLHNGLMGYTSPGLGCSLLPVRFNCAPELTLIELNSIPCRDLLKPRAAKAFHPKCEGEQTSVHS
jgi:uncharacterized protein